MPLKKCPDCDSDVGENAVKCPKCGHHFERWGLLILIAVILVLILFLGAWLSK